MSSSPPALAPAAALSPAATPATPGNVPSAAPGAASAGAAGVADRPARRAHAGAPVPLYAAALWDMHPDGWLVVDGQGRVLDANPVAVGLLGLDSGRLAEQPERRDFFAPAWGWVSQRGVPLLGVLGDAPYPPDDVHPLRTVLAGGGDVRGVILGCVVGGLRLWMRTSARLIAAGPSAGPSTGSSGGAPAALVLVQDATNLMVWGEASERLAAILRQTDDAVVTTDAEGHFEYANPAWYRMTGWGEDDTSLDGRDPDAVLAGLHTDPQHAERVTRARREGVSVGGQVLSYRKDGTPFWRETTSSPLRDEDGVIRAYVAVERDVTLRKAAERDRQRLTAAVRIAPDAICLTDMSGDLEFANAAAARLYGYPSPDAMLGVPLRDLFSPDDARVVRDYVRRAETLGHWSGECVGRMHDGVLRPVDASLSYLAGGMVWVARDASGRRAHEAALLEASRVDDLTRLLNRRGFFHAAGLRLEQAQRDGQLALLLFGDLDGFKAINDTHGHAVGDEALRMVARALQSTLRSTDLLARLAGDEFTVFITAPSEAMLPQVAVLEERLAYHLGQQTLGHPFTLSMSLGAVVATPDNPQGLDPLLAIADSRLYERKAARKAARRAAGLPVRAEMPAPDGPRPDAPRTDAPRAAGSAVARRDDPPVGGD